jgi:hypothetical protein
MDEWIYANSGLLAGVCVLLLLGCFELSGWISWSSIFLDGFTKYFSVIASIRHGLFLFVLKSE